MPRTARFEELGLPHHVIFQGIERCPIVRDDTDRDRFVRVAARVLSAGAVDVLAWALMPNHGHLVLRATDQPLGQAMHRVLCSYAVWFNRRHERVGRLFRDRFWSRPVEDDSDLHGLIGYVLLNPVRGGIVTGVGALPDYPWTALAELYQGRSRRRTLVDRVATLALFGNDSATALSKLTAFLHSALSIDPAGDRHARDEPSGESCLGLRVRTDLRAASMYALRLRSERIDAALRRREGFRVMRLRLERRGWTLDRVLDRAAGLCGVIPDGVRSGSRRRRECRARALVAYFAHVYLGSSDAEIARATGIGRQSVARSRLRAQIDLDTDATAWRAFFEIGVD